MNPRWRWLPIAFACCANSASSSDDGARDPGRPASEFGAKCEGELVEAATGAKWSFHECTVLASSGTDISHVYFDVTRLPGGVKRLYASLVLDAAPLVAGVHERARAGAIDVILEDGRWFSAGDVRTGGILQLVIDRADQSAAGDHFYVTGSLQVMLAGVENSSLKLLLRAEINRMLR
jgi:hypothetical protein